MRKLKKTSEEQKISGVDYQERLREFQSSTQKGVFDWSQKREAEDENDDLISQLMKTDTRIASKMNTRLQPDMIAYERKKPITDGDKHSSIVSIVDFHPDQNLMLTGGLDKKLRFYKVDPTEKIHSFFLKDLPIYTGGFILGGSEVLLSGNRKHFYSFDVEKQTASKITNIFGHPDEIDLRGLIFDSDSDYLGFTSKAKSELMVLSAKSKQLLFDLKHTSGKIVGGGFLNDHEMFTLTQPGEIWHWDLRKREVLSKTADLGNFKATCMTVSKCGKYMATGSYSGSVNIYDARGFTSESKPMKSLENLTTSISMLKFNPTSEILAFGTKWGKNGFRMAHVPSCQVY